MRGKQDAQEEIRIKVVEYLKKKLGTQNKASQIFGITDRAVNRIWSKYKLTGKRSLNSKKRGVKGGKKINGQGSAEVRNLIKNKLPDQLKLPFGLWTREAVQRLILERLGQW